MDPDILLKIGWSLADRHLKPTSRPGRPPVGCGYDAGRLHQQSSGIKGGVMTCPTFSSKAPPDTIHAR